MEHCGLLEVLQGLAKMMAAVYRSHKQWKSKCVGTGMYIWHGALKTHPKI
jgi:stress response protein SCP2